jgi:hypothetical protein
MSSTEINKKSRGRPKKNADIHIKIIDKQTKNEYNKMYHQLNKEKVNESAKERYYSHTEERKEYNGKLQKKYRDAFKILKDMLEENKISPDYTDKVNNIIHLDITRHPTTTIV